MPWMYIVRCTGGAFYSGSTNGDVEFRVAEHNAGLGANFTRRHRPVTLVYCEEWPTVAQAYEREKQVQGWGRAKKLALIEGRGSELPGLARGRQRKDVG
ncbi:GIY-YIG nuclease family protein [Agromyces mediolanus]|uniref:GIY-YIG nuclease family protein n=1 Tax=Agromyces mediolanus TaxID=41986 RepID=UPI00166D3B4B|nr:GIY-YIG nuclease family protein [Agromyces mediolanus]GLJ74057.1 hypothetical protein GCM10017583_33160 [Agromyces mediolanus]